MYKTKLNDLLDLSTLRVAEWSSHTELGLFFMPRPKKLIEMAIELTGLYKVDLP